MYAVVRTGGKQYKVAVNDVLKIETLAGEKGDEVALADVLMVSDDAGIRIGKDVGEASVKGQIIRQGRGEKVIIFKKRRRKSSKTKNGHRQNFTEIKITNIGN